MEGKFVCQGLVLFGFHQAQEDILLDGTARMLPNSMLVRGWALLY
jgi:hypothetical protein